MKILAVQNRMGIGDMIIFLPFIEAISKKFNAPISILVKENSKAIQVLKNCKYIDRVIILDRDNKNKNGKHDGLLGFINLVKDLKKYNFDKIFMFNSSLRFNLIAKLSKIKNIYQYPLFQKKNQHIIDTASKFIKDSINIDVKENPKINISNENKQKARLDFNIDDSQINILLGIGGSGSTKRVPSRIFIKFMKLCSDKYNCRFFLATGQNKEEQKILDDITNSDYKQYCTSLDKLPIEKIIPLISNCNISVCNDSSFSHLSAAVGINTIVLMTDTPLIYGTYSSKMYAIIPDGENTVSHNTLGKEKINPEKIFIKLKEILG